MENKKINVGLVGMGLNTYWSQFEGLYEKLCKYQKKIADSLTRPDISIINAGILDRPEEAKNIADVLSHENIEVLFCLYLDICAIIYDITVGTTSESSHNTIKHTALFSHRLYIY